ncbi:MAG: trimethylamine methyltransferase family protein, partial [Anaerolineales bacterium]
AQILSLDKLVLDNHLARQIEIMLAPIKVDKEHLQVDTIKHVGVGGEFLSQRETLRYTRAEYTPLWPPHGEDLLALVHSEALDILHNHQSPPLPVGAEEKIESLLQEAEQALGRGTP